jgi:hypothetical protein
MDQRLSPAMSRPCSVADMRSLVQFCMAIDVIDPTTGKSVKQFTYTLPEYACIRNIGTQLFFQGYDTEMEFSHTIYVRYRSDAGAYTQIMEEVILPDTGQLQRLQYEIIRSTDWMGVRLFNRFDCRLQSRQS